MRIDPTTMPPVIASKPIAAAAAELTRLAVAAAVAREQAHALEVARADVEAADRRALGRALAEGKPDPGTKALADHDADIATARRRHQALEAAVTEAASAFTTVVERHRSAWLEAVESEATKARAKYAALVAELVAARAKLDEQAAVARWIRRWPAPKAYAAVAPPVFGLVSRNGDPFGWAEVADALTADAAPPEPVKLSSPVAAA